MIKLNCLSLGKEPSSSHADVVQATSTCSGYAATTHKVPYFATKIAAGGSCLDLRKRLSNAIDPDMSDLLCPCPPVEVNDVVMPSCGTGPSHRNAANGRDAESSRSHTDTDVKRPRSVVWHDLDATDVGGGIDSFRRLQCLVSVRAICVPIQPKGHRHLCHAGEVDLCSRLCVVIDTVEQHAPVTAIQRS